MSIPHHNLQYFEGRLQLRNYREEVLRFVINQVAKDPGVHIAKEKMVKNGLDLYMSSNKFLRKLGKKLKNSFTGTLKESVKLHTRDKQTSKNLYRLTVMFRCYPFRKGDKVILKGDEVIIQKIGTQILVKDAKTGAKKRCKFEDLVLH